MRSDYYLLTSGSDFTIALWNGEFWFIHGVAEPQPENTFDSYNKQEITGVSSYGNMTAIKQLYG